MRYAKIEIEKLDCTAVLRRRLVCDGYVMLNEKDICAGSTDDFEDIVSRMDGVVLTSYEAKVELSKNKYKWLSK